MGVRPMFRNIVTAFVIGLPTVGYGWLCYFAPLHMTAFTILIAWVVGVLYLMWPVTPDPKTREPGSRP